MTHVEWPEVRDLPDEMQAVRFHEFGGPEVLRYERVPLPEVPAGHVLVKVAAVSVGRLLDIAARSGTHPWARFDLPHILGAENAGVIAAAAPDVTGVAVGDRVAVFPGMVPADDAATLAGHQEWSPQLRVLGTHVNGAYAEYIAIPAGNVLPAPDDLAPDEAAAVVVAGAVAMNQFTRTGGVGPGSRVIVQGASSALGSTTALLAAHLGAEVIVTSRGEAKRQRLHELGFAHVLDATDAQFPTQAREAFGGAGATLIVDNLGAPDVWSHGFDSLDIGGTIVSSGSFLSREVPLKLGLLYSRNQRVIGVRTANPKSVAELWTHVRNGFRTVIDRRFPLADAADAHRYIENSANVGRVVLLP